MTEAERQALAVLAILSNRIPSQRLPVKSPFTLYGQIKQKCQVSEKEKDAQ